MSNCTLHVRSPQGLIYKIPVGSEPARGLQHQLKGSVVLALELRQEQHTIFASPSSVTEMQSRHVVYSSADADVTSGRVGGSEMWVRWCRENV